MRIYRVKDWWYYPGLVVLGHLVVEAPTRSLILSFLASFFLGCFSFSLNEVRDRNLPSSYHKYILLPLIPLFLLLLFLDSFRIIIILTLVFLAFVYSYPPFSLKKIPVVGTLINAIGFPLLIFLGAGKVGRDTLLLYLLYFFLSLPAQLIHEYSHQEEDKKKGILTTALLWGEKGKDYLWIFLLPVLLFLLFLPFLFPFILLLILTLYLKKDNLISLRKWYRWENLFLGIFLLFYYRP